MRRIFARKVARSKPLTTDDLAKVAGGIIRLVSYCGDGGHMQPDDIDEP